MRELYSALLLLQPISASSMVIHLPSDFARQPQLRDFCVRITTSHKTCTKASYGRNNGELVSSSSKVS